MLSTRHELKKWVQHSAHHRTRRVTVEFVRPGGAPSAQKVCNMWNAAIDWILDQSIPPFFFAATIYSSHWPLQPPLLLLQYQLHKVQPCKPNLLIVMTSSIGSIREGWIFIVNTNLLIKLIMIIYSKENFLDSIRSTLIYLVQLFTLYENHWKQDFNEIYKI